MFLWVASGWDANCPDVQVCGFKCRSVDICEAATYNQDGHEAGDGGVPVSTGGGRFAHQDTVKDEISEAELDSPYSRSMGKQSLLHHTPHLGKTVVEVNQTHCPAPARPPASWGAVSLAPPPSRCVLLPRLLRQEDKKIKCRVYLEKTQL